jgi:hypothetical protein
MREKLGGTTYLPFVTIKTSEAIATTAAAETGEEAAGPLPGNPAAAAATANSRATAPTASGNPEAAASTAAAARTPTSAATTTGSLPDMTTTEKPASGGSKTPSPSPSTRKRRPRTKTT